MSLTLDDLPEPDGVPLLGHAVELLAEPMWDVLTRYAAKHGSMVQLSLPPNRALLLSDPALVEAVLDPHHPGIDKGRVGRRAFEIPGSDDPFLAKGGADWKRRRSAHPLSHRGVGAWLDAARRPLQILVERTLVGWIARGGAFDLWRALRELVFGMLSTVYTGRDLTRAGFDRYDEITRTVEIKNAIDLGLGRFLPDLSIDDGGFETWRSHMLRALPREPLPGSLASRLGAMGHARPVRQAVDHFMAAAFAGAMSTPAAIASVIELLAGHPTVARTLSKALREVPVVDGTLDPVALRACTPLNQVIRETLRVLPPVPIMMRSTHADRAVDVGGVEMPPGTLILMSPCIPHGDRTLWPDPHAFDPERWTPDVIAARPFGCPAFHPFGRGPRSCLGARTALQIIEIAVAALTLECRLDLVSDAYRQRTFTFACAVPEELIAEAYAR